MGDSLPTWVRQAQSLPIAFAQVREDPLIDLHIVRKLPQKSRIIMIASGGCTAVVLACEPNVAHLHLVDANPAQIALTRLKLRLCQSDIFIGRSMILGHVSTPPSIRLEMLASHMDAIGVPLDRLGPPALLAEWGPDFAGRYERLFAAIRDGLRDVESEMTALLFDVDLAEQQRRAAPNTPLGRRIDEVFDDVMSLPNLVALFGPEATNNPVMPFARHFAQRLRHVLATIPARFNPYLWQMLRCTCACFTHAPWLAADMHPVLPDIKSTIGPMGQVLAEERDYDFVHLSNILDWLTPAQATQTLEATARALKPGGYVLIRQLNSTLDIPAAGPMFDWLEDEARALHAIDRSFFYRALHLGRKR